MSEGHPLRVAGVCGSYFCCISLGRIKGTGAYMIDRKAAQAFTTHLLPMRVPTITPSIVNGPTTYGRRPFFLFR
jgi:hypothetical protein